MKIYLLPCVGVLYAVLCGCAMFSSWKAIPPPGGCDQCHTVPIGNNWQVTYQAPHLTDERNREYFQSAEATMPARGRLDSSLDLRKAEDLQCFECHRAPNQQHVERKGRYHH
jgi:hypothetical protein